MPNPRRRTASLRLVAAALLLTPVILATLLRQSLPRAVSDYDIQRCLDNPWCYPYAGFDPTAAATPTPILGNIRVRGLSTETYQTLSCPEVRALTSGITGAQLRVDGPMRHSGAKRQVRAAGMM